MAAEFLIEFHSEARVEMREVFEWQREHRSDDRAARLIAAVDIGIESIYLAPDRWPLVRGMTPTTRLRLVGDGFEFIIYYRVRPKGIFVLALASHKQRPFYWAHRR